MSGEPATYNGATARSHGSKLEVNASIAQGTRAALGYAYTDAKVTQTFVLHDYPSFALIPSGIEPDLMEASKMAVRGMIDVITHAHGLTAEAAYMLCMCLRRSADQRDRRSTELGRLVLLPRVVFD